MDLLTGSLQLLLAHKAAVNARDNDGRTPLHNSTGDVASELLAHGAQVNATDTYGGWSIMTPHVMYGCNDIWAQ